MPRPWHWQSSDAASPRPLFGIPRFRWSHRDANRFARRIGNSFAPALCPRAVATLFPGVGFAFASRINPNLVTATGPRTANRAPGPLDAARTPRTLCSHLCLPPACPETRRFGFPSGLSRSTYSKPRILHRCLSQASIICASPCQRTPARFVFGKISQAPVNRHMSHGATSGLAAIGVTSLRGYLIRILRARRPPVRRARSPHVGGSEQPATRPWCLIGLFSRVSIPAPFLMPPPSRAIDQLRFFSRLKMSAAVNSGAFPPRRTVKDGLGLRLATR